MRREGVLPIALGGDIRSLARAGDAALSGLRAALFHPTTSYRPRTRWRRRIWLATSTRLRWSG
jgi:hypothetical protein